MSNMKSILSSVVALLMVLTSGCISLSLGGDTGGGMQSPASAWGRPDLLIIAHRGQSGVFPENTMLAFQGALRTGADFYELDAHLTKDGVPVVLHDGDLKRTAGLEGKKVQDLTLAEVKELDAGSWKGSQFAGEKIPTLREALAWSKDKIDVMVELKSGNPGLAEKAVAIIQEVGMVKNVVLASFDESYIKTAKALEPSMRTLGLQSKMVEWEREDDSFADILGCAVSEEITEEMLRAVHMRGMQVWVWTVDKPEDMERLAKMGVDGIISNYPERLTGRAE
ncbi:MAG: glycerophosphodiester phosphodiesterase family protein [Verrucomicrobiota bacterium]|jgi:glycerophosphoryl diester phosphodiesterase|nr:glycerophosphodiester phosphodiesterase family protein [Verrucomicrobiota bacterium]